MASNVQRDELLRLQRLLLPSSLPTIGCTESAAAYRADNHDFHLGGDWFDLIDRPESNSVVAVVGDVVGHGVEQISVMGQLRAACNALSRSLIEPNEILVGLDLFAAGIPGALMTTLCVLVFDGTETARISSAGHLPPIVVRADGRVDVVELGRRAPLAVRGAGASPGEFGMTVGDLIVLYTDGVVERRGESIDAGIARLGDFVLERRSQPCRQIAASIVDEFGADAVDDQAVLVLRPHHDRSPDYDRDRLIPSSVSWERVEQLA